MVAISSPTVDVPTPDLLRSVKANKWHSAEQNVTQGGSVVRDVRGLYHFVDVDLHQGCG